MQVRTALFAPAKRAGGPKKGSQSRDLLKSFETPAVASDSSKSESGVAGAGAASLRDWVLLRDWVVPARCFLTGASSSELEFTTYVCGRLADGAIFPSN